MGTALLYVAGGIALLVIGGDALVKGAVALALRLGIPALIVGLTVVAFGTSAPELLVAVTAALEGRAGIAVGGVVGSNIVNILLILGIPAMLTTVHSSQSDTGRSYLIMLATTALFIGLAFLGPLDRWHGLILLGTLVAVLLDNIRTARAHLSSEPEIVGDEDFMPVSKIAVFTVAGLVALGMGANFLVSGAVSIARAVGASETVVGLTLVALGTSLPELVTSIVAAIRGEADVAMGNVIGSNIFNVLLILGTTATIAPLPVDQDILLRDIWVMAGAALLLMPFALFRRDITRLAGAGLVGVYGVYALSLVE